MKPVVTVEEMRTIDDAAPAGKNVLVERAGRAVAIVAKRMLGGVYGRRVTVICGKGNNGADGRVAASHLQRAGVRVICIDASEVRNLDTCDLVIDAAYGTGFRGEYSGPQPLQNRVLAVDIPSGVQGDSGTRGSSTLRAEQTVTFAALKPGHVFGPGADLCGDIEVADIGLDVSTASMSLLEEADVRKTLPVADSGTHKWKWSVTVVAGSPGMQGAAQLCAGGAARAGAGMVRLMVPGASDESLPASEAVATGMPEAQWAPAVLRATERTKAIVVGPGLGRSTLTIESVLELLDKSDMPVIVDGDALFAVSSKEGKQVLKNRRAPTILTPHDGEFERLNGATPLDRRWKSAAELADDTHAVVLLKGSTTVVARSGGHTLICNTGRPHLATAGTGDVLAGVIGAFVARGVDADLAAACGAYVHGAAAQLGHNQGLIAGDLPPLVAEWMSS